VKINNVGLLELTLSSLQALIVLVFYNKAWPLLYAKLRADGRHNEDSQLNMSCALAIVWWIFRSSG